MNLFHETCNLFWSAQNVFLLENQNKLKKLRKRFIAMKKKQFVTLWKEKKNFMKKKSAFVISGFVALSDAQVICLSLKLFMANMKSKQSS